MVSEIVTEEGSYQTAFCLLQESKEVGLSGWVSRLRESAMDRFEQLGFPTVKEEDWKYTNVAPISRTRFEPQLPDSDRRSVSAELLKDFLCPETSQSQIVFVNGIWQPRHSSIEGLPQEVVALDLAEAMTSKRHEQIVLKHLARIADYNSNGFTALNTAFLTSGAFMLIPKGIAVEVPIHLLYVSDPSRASVASFPRVLLVVEENASVKIVESYAGFEGAPTFTNAVMEIVLKDGARLDHYRVQRESATTFHIATTAADLGKNSRYDSTAINYGAQLSRHDLDVTMDREGAECWLDGLYFVTGTQHADTHSVIDHRQPHCTSHQLYKGILDGRSRAVFNGKIFVRHDAQQTDARQTNKNLLLSNEARVDTKPQLEILADDVKCAHGAAVGQIDEDELFYLATRGINPDLAKNLLTYGFAEEIIGKITLSSIRNQLEEAVLNRLQATLEAEPV